MQVDHMKEFFVSAIVCCVMQTTRTAMFATSAMGCMQNRMHRNPMTLHGWLMSL